MKGTVMDKIEITFKDTLVYVNHVPSGMLHGVMLPNFIGDGRTLMMQGGLVGWFEPIKPEDELAVKYTQVNKT